MAIEKMAFQIKLILKTKKYSIYIVDSFSKCSSKAKAKTSIR
jgi:hypothetical protein